MSIVMLADTNSAYLSWTAAYEKSIGLTRDLRNEIAIIGGNGTGDGRGIVLAKSPLAKAGGCKTGMSILEAKQLFRPGQLIIVPPNFSLYIRASKALRELFYSYTPLIDQYSIDECFMKFDDVKREDALELANEMKKEVKDRFGYTVSIGIGTNKLTAKMASEFNKIDGASTLFPDEIESKMWPLDVGDLFFVGSKTKKKLNNYGIYTIGDLANADYKFISSSLKSHGRLIYTYAHGHDNSIFKPYSDPMKSVGNSSTLRFNVEDSETAKIIILSLTELTAWRLRDANKQCRVVGISIKNSDFNYYTRQQTLLNFTDCTNDIYRSLCDLFDKTWNRSPIRQLGVFVTDLENAGTKQLDMFQSDLSRKNEQLDKTIDKLRDRFGSKSIMRGVFANSEFSPLLGGYPEGYQGMRSIL